MGNDTILQKPPRLLHADQNGAYDWREFDRWVRRVHDMLSVRSDSDAFSIISELEAMRSSAFMTSESASTVDDDMANLLHTVVESLPYTAPDESYLTLYWMGV